MISTLYNKISEWGRGFRAVQLREEQGLYVNPGRGWYQIYTFRPGLQPLNLDEIVLSEQESLALVLIDIGYYRSKPIDEKGLEEVRSILERFQSKDREMIVRIVYDVEGCGMLREPDSFRQVLQHMRQLGPVVARYADAVFVCQGVFVGNWGEMHGSKFLSSRHIKDLIHTWSEATNHSVRMAVRRPVQYRMVEKESLVGSMEYDKVGFFDDAILASDTHLGTYAQVTENGKPWNQPWALEEEAAFMEPVMRRIPFGGEAVYGEPVALEQVVERMKMLHVSYLNCVHDKNMLDLWKTQKRGQETLYEYMGNHMGYRFVVKSVRMPNVRKDDKRYVELELENTGFANLCDEVDCEMVCTSGEEVSCQKVQYDMRQLSSGQKVQLRQEIGKLPEEETVVSLRMVRKKDGAAIRFANEGAGEKLVVGMIKGRGEKHVR